MNLQSLSDKHSDISTRITHWYSNYTLILELQISTSISLVLALHSTH